MPRLGPPGRTPHARHRRIGNTYKLSIGQSLATRKRGRAVVTQCLNTTQVCGLSNANIHSHTLVAYPRNKEYRCVKCVDVGR